MKHVQVDVAPQLHKKYLFSLLAQMQWNVCMCINHLEYVGMCERVRLCVCECTSVCACEREKRSQRVGSLCLRERDEAVMDTFNP